MLKDEKEDCHSSRHNPLRASGRPPPDGPRGGMFTALIGPRQQGRKSMSYGRSLACACVVLSLAPCVLVSRRASAQGNYDPLANVPRLLHALDRDGFDALQGQFKVLDAVKNACAGIIPSAWYNNVQPYMVAMLPGRVGDHPAWETTDRSLAPAYFLRQDEAVLLVGSTPPPMAYFSFQTFLFMRYNLDSYHWDPTTGGFFAPYAARSE